MPEKFAFHDLDGIFADIVAAIVKGVGQDGQRKLIVGNGIVRTTHACGKEATLLSLL